jgi:Flp pilus assembly protein TadG
MKTPRRTAKTKKGQSLIELTLVLPILLLILVGVVEFGMIFFQYIAMRDAAQEGAVYTSIYPTACNQAIERVKKDLYNTDPSQVEVIVEINGVQCDHATAADACASKEVKITVYQHDYKITTPFLGTVLGKQTLDISTSVTSSIIRPPCL